MLVAVPALIAFACAAPGGASAAGGLKKCRVFTVVRIKHGHRVHVRVRKCVVVPSNVEVASRLKFADLAITGSGALNPQMSRAR